MEYAEEGEAVSEAVRRRCAELYRQLSRDAILRQNDPVETIYQFVMAERNEAIIRYEASKK
jgi:hypothetical protein